MSARTRVPTVNVPPEEAVRIPSGPGGSAVSGSVMTADINPFMPSSAGDVRREMWFRSVMWLAAMTALMVMGLLGVTIAVGARPSLVELGTGFVFSTTWNPSAQQFGLLPLIYGTLVVSTIAVIIAVPASLGIALFVTEVAGRRVASAVGSTIDVLAAVPSVVFGLWGFYHLVPLLRTVLLGISGAVEVVPLLRSLLGPSSGAGYAAAGMIVALMITPIITSVAREVIATVPHNDRMGALALGTTRWEMIRGVVLHHSRAGLVGAVMLGLGRAMGETVAVALLIGASPHLSANLFGRGEAMTSQIFRSLSESGGTLRSVLFVLAGLLLIATIVVNLIARRAVVVFSGNSGVR